MNKNAQVAVVKCDDYAEVQSAVRRGLELLGGMEKFLRPGWKVLLKPNLLFGSPPGKAVNTHPSLLSALVKLVREAGCYPLIGDSPVIGASALHAKIAGYWRICQENGIPWINFEDQGVEVWSRNYFKRLLLARPALEADAIINLPKVKTHGQTFLSLAVKNMFGIVPGARKTQWHLEAGNDPELFARLLLEVCYFKKPVLNIVDGIIAMDGNGPRTGRPFHLGYLIAGPDPTAVDITICQILQTDPLNLPTIRSAQKMNLGFHDPREIIIIGDSPDYFRSKNFRFCRQTLPINVSVIGRIVPLIKGAVNSKPYIDQKICSVCQQCLEICPPEAMSLEILKKDHTEKIAIDLDRCIRCYCCNEVCAEGAISIKEGWIWNFIPNFLK